MGSRSSVVRALVAQTSNLGLIPSDFPTSFLHSLFILSLVFTSFYKYKGHMMVFMYTIPSTLIMCTVICDCHLCIQGTAHFIVTVRDVNDNRPVFVDQQYFGTVAEEQPVGTAATLVCDSLLSPVQMHTC